MFSNFKFVATYLARSPRLLNCTFRNNIPSATISTTLPKTKDKPSVVDIDMDTMMFDSDDDFEKKDNQDSISSSVGGDAPIAPIDIDPWVEEEEQKHGTVDIDPYQKDPEELPPIPAKRSGVFEVSSGLKVILPQKMLKPETYRYRLEKEDQDLADDIRVCKFKEY